MSEFMHLTDGYKLDHRRQYPAGTERVLANFTPRSSRLPGQKTVTFVGLQAVLYSYFMDRAKTEFFGKPKELVLTAYQQLLDGYFGPDAGKAIGVEHIGALHDLGYIPLRFKALPEGTAVPIGVPMFTIENTLPEFFWVTNYFETLISSAIWIACTSATQAGRYRAILNDAALRTTGSTEGVQWQGHDFSFRGMASPEAAAMSGLGHLLFFTGTDTLPAIDLARTYYAAEGLIAGSVPATEHSVMCASGQESELETYNRILDLYPTGIVSVVSDTWDLWNVLTNILPRLKGRIMARSGKLVIRPDSGDPADILCGGGMEDNEENIPGGYYRWKDGRVGTPQYISKAEYKGVVELLWDLFGGTINAQGFKVLDSHIGAIYGDSITEARAIDITKRLEAKGLASTNVVYGIGSYTYQYVTRDTHGFAIKATWTQRDGEGHDMQKDPVTGSGKKSACGRVAVYAGSDGTMFLMDRRPLRQIDPFTPTDQLQTVWEDGQFIKTWTLAEVRERALSSLSGTSR